MTAEALGSLLRSKKLTIAVAESCTGGMLGSMITSVAGSSDYFLGGVISYGNDAKTRLLGVDVALIESKGAVSEEVASRMAQGAMRQLKADIGVGITGVAGPSGGTPQKPIGLVYIAVCSSSHTICERNLFGGSRADVRTKAAEKALEMVAEFVRAHY